MATIDGVFRLYPALPRNHMENEDGFLGSCRQFDPRLRPWYTAASTGAKDVVFVIDQSKTMMEGDGWKWKAAVDAVLLQDIDALDAIDYFNVIAFAKSENRLHLTNYLIAGTEENKSNMATALKNIRPKEESMDMKKAFKSAFDLLRNAADASEYSKCGRLIVFLTDMRPRQTSGTPNPSVFLKKIQEYQNELLERGERTATISIFTFRRDADDSVPRQIACNNNGFWGLIEDIDHVSEVMADSFLFLASSFQSDSIVWSRPFLSNSDLGWVRTVAAATYSPGTNGKWKNLIGVVAKDILVSDIEKDDDFDDILANRQSEANCVPSSKHPCHCN